MKRLNSIKPTLHLMVGLPCSGKTTLARQLERDLPALRLTPDEWQMRLFGDDQDNKRQHDERHTLIETLMWQAAERALTLGINVILDYGFWAREEREDFRERARRLGAASEVHFTYASREELFKRMEERNAAGLTNVFHIYPEDLSQWWDFFQAPDEAELRRRE